MQTAEKLSITIPAEMAKMIRHKVKIGDYGSNSEVIREALRGWMEREKRARELDAAMAKGIADADEGRVMDIKSAQKAMRKRYQT